MSGTKYLLDTNAVIGLLSGNEALEQTLSKADWIGISAISVIEFFAFSGLSSADKLLFTTFLSRVEILEVPSTDINFLESIAAFKLDSRLKLPDAIIASFAIHHEAVLVSNDKGFTNITKLSLLTF